MVYIKLFRELQKNILPKYGKILELVNLCPLRSYQLFFSMLFVLLSKTFLRLDRLL